MGPHSPSLEPRNPRTEVRLKGGRNRQPLGRNPSALLLVAGLLYASENSARAAEWESGSGAPALNTNASPATAEQRWNWHVQNTDIIQGHPGFSADYSGANSMSSSGEIRETVSLDLIAGLRLWPGAEAHVDGLVWQGFGFSKTLGAEAFPNGEAFRLGTDIPNINVSRLFLRQTIGFGGQQESVTDDALHLAGPQDVSRLSFTAGRMSSKDIFDNNSYANDPRTQFMNWAFMANEAWDYPADSLGYITGAALELNQPLWAARYGFFQVPKRSNGVALDQNLLRAWGMVAELERRYILMNRRGAVRVLGFLNQADMGNYEQAVDNAIRPADIQATRAYRDKFGFGLNFEQELTADLGLFCRLGWSDGQNEAWMFSDVDRTATLGVSLKGRSWHRPDDTLGVAGALGGASREHHDFLTAGGLGILAGDGRLNYGLEQTLETYYDARVWKAIHAALDFQFINNPAFNRDRGPVLALGARLHWEW